MNENDWVVVDGVGFRKPVAEEPARHSLGVFVDRAKKQLGVETDMELAGLMDIELNTLSHLRITPAHSLMAFIDHLPVGATVGYVFRKRPKSMQTPWPRLESCYRKYLDRSAS